MENKIKQLTEKQQREFALICASRAVDKVNIPELTDYFTLVCLEVESDMLEEVKREEEFWSAYRSVYSTVKGDVLEDTRKRAVYWASDGATGEAACITAYLVSDGATDEAENKIQNEILDNMLMQDN